MRDASTLPLFEEPKVVPFDISARKHGGNRQSTAANLRIEPHKAGLRERVRVFIAATQEYGATCSEIAEKFNLAMHRISGRCSELKALELVFDSGRLRNKGSVLVARKCWVNVSART